jgi:predicted RNA-binding protein with PIN domain
MSNPKNEPLEEKVDFEKARKEHISKLTSQFGEDKIEYIARLYDSYFQLIGEKTTINHHLIPFFVYKETRADLIDESGKSKKLGK